MPRIISALCCFKPPKEEIALPTTCRSNAESAPQDTAKGGKEAKTPSKNAGKGAFQRMLSGPGGSRDASDPRQALGKDIYEEGRYYQGTTASLGNTRKAQGMDPASKQGSSIVNAFKFGYFDHKSEEWRENFSKATSEHHYFTAIKEGGKSTMGAKEYALLAAGINLDTDDTITPVAGPSGRRDEPKILRAFLPQETVETVKLESDPDSEKRNKAFRTKDVVPPGFILSSKKDAPEINEASRAFQAEFNRRRPALQIDTDITPKEAATMLKELQTDSATDFPEQNLPPWRK